MAPRSSKCASLEVARVTGVGGALIASVLVSVALGGCSTSGGVSASGTDWPAYAADVYAMPAPERAALAAEASADYAGSGSADAAIRWAILLAAPGGSEDDLATAIGLLNSAEAGSANRDFIGLLRPLLLDMQAQRSELAAESLARQSLEEQLEQLKSLEEALNASVPQR